MASGNPAAASPTNVPCVNGPLGVGQACNSPEIPQTAKFPLVKVNKLLKLVPSVGVSVVASPSNLILTPPDLVDCKEEGAFCIINGGTEPKLASNTSDPPAPPPLPPSGLIYLIVPSCFL